VSHTGVHARLVPLHILKNQALVADYDSIHWTDSQWNVLKEQWLTI
jgi:hypothetical protein